MTVLELPSGRRIHGRGLCDGPPMVPPDFGLYCLGAPPAPLPWESRWIAWPDFRLPREPVHAAFAEVLRRAETQRVEVCCQGGRGRTGTALACIAILDGVAPEDAVAFVREHYHPHAVETPWQRRFVRRFSPPA